MVQEALSGNVIDFDTSGMPNIPNLDGLDKFIEDNEGSESDALKALWVQFRMEMEWKDYAVAAHKNILKLATNYQKIVAIISESTGTLGRQGFKTEDGKTLILHEKFQDMVDLGQAVKFQAIEKKTTERRIRAIRYLEKDEVEIVLTCGHSEMTTKEIAKEKGFKRGDVMVCPVCVDMMQKLMHEL